MLRRNLRFTNVAVVTLALGIGANTAIFSSINAIFLRPPPAIIGVYGVISCSVSQQVHEIGIRLALGAQRRHILGLLIWQGLKFVLLGIAAGTAGAWGLTRYMASLLFGVSATDPATFASVAILLALVSVFACYVPARRALRFDPMIALRCE